MPPDPPNSLAGSVVIASALIMADDAVCARATSVFKVLDAR